MGSGGGALARKLKDLQLATKGEQVTRKKDALGFKAVERIKSPAKKSTMKLNGVYGTQPARRRREMKISQNSWISCAKNRSNILRD
jgi:hypothetical protein